MSNVTAKVRSTLLVGVAAVAVAVVLAAQGARAADNCLTEPKGETQGRHWYYHIEHGTGRHCWYLRGEDGKSARADGERTAASEEPAPRKRDAASSRSIADAHAEIAARTGTADTGNAAAARSVWPNAPAASAAAPTGTPNGSSPSDPAAQGSPLVSRWPQAADAAAPTPSPSPQPEATLMVADAQADTNAEISPPPASAAIPAERQIGSIQKLALVAAGALTLAGVTGSAVYRLGRRRRRREWLQERSGWQSAQNPNSPPWAEPDMHPHPHLADPDEVHPTAPESDFALAMGDAGRGDDRVEKIEEFLARLTQQLHEELEGTRPHNA